MIPHGAGVPGNQLYQRVRDRPRERGKRVPARDELEWWERFRTHHDVYASIELFRELQASGFRGREQALALVANVPVLDTSAGAVGLAQVLVREQVMPGPAGGGDALHVAIAVMHAMDYMLSWNVRHLANPHKVTHLQRVCLRFAVVPSRIVTPDLLWETEP